jgi:hypothetical protein
MTTITTKNVPKMFHKFFCEKCDYRCSKKSVFDKHLLTKKHNTTKYNKIQQDDNTCECGKSYTHRASLYNHKKKCEKVAKSCQKMFHETIDTEDENLNMKGLILKVLNENKELVHTISEQQKTIQSMVPKLGNNNNNKININVYLNEHCKDALTLEDMTESIKLTLGDLCNASNCGLITNVQNLLINRLNETEENKRPIHCTDLKRRILYVKDRDGWNKDEKHDKLKASLVKIANDHMSCFAEEYNQDEEIGSDDEKYVNIMSEVSKDVVDDEKGMNKAITNIAGAVKLQII